MNTVVYVAQCAVEGCLRRAKKGKKLCEPHQEQQDKKEAVFAHIKKD